MAKKDTLDSTLAPDAPIAALIYASARSPGLTVSKYLYSLINCSFPTSSISTKTYFKKLKIQMTIKLLSTTPLHPAPFQSFPRVLRLTPWLYCIQLPISNEKLKFSCYLHQHKNKNKKTKIKIDDKFTFCYPPAPNAFSTVSIKSSARYPGLTLSNFSYSLRHSNFHAISTITKKTEKQKNHKLQ